MLARAVGRSVSPQTELLFGEQVSGNFFRMYGVRPALGRALHSSDDRPGGSEPGAGVTAGAPLCEIVD